MLISKKDYQTNSEAPAITPLKFIKI